MKRKVTDDNPSCNKRIRHESLYRLGDLFPQDPEIKSNGYDIGFNFLKLNIDYDKALAEKDLEKMALYANEIYRCIEDSYQKFSAFISNNLLEKRIKNISLKDYLTLIKSQIEAARYYSVHPREVMEIVLIKLAFLRDLSKTYDFKCMEDPTREVGCIYLRDELDGLAYELLDLDKQIKKGRVLWEDLPLESTAEMLLYYFNKIEWVKTFMAILDNEGCIVKDAIVNDSLFEMVANAPGYPAANIGGNEFFNPQQSSDYFYHLKNISDQEKTRLRDAYISHVMTLSLTEDPVYLKKEIGTGLLGVKAISQESYEQFIQNNKVLPFCSNTGIIGFSVWLTAVFNDYLPVGFGVNPPGFHANYYQKQSLWSARHDYIHNQSSVLRLKENMPELYESLKEIFYSLPHSMYNEADIKSDIIMIFFIINDLISHFSDCKWLSFQKVKELIDLNTMGIKEGLAKASQEGYQSYVQRYLHKKTEPKPRKPFSIDDFEVMTTLINSFTVFHTIDFVKPLQNIGYHFFKTNDKKPWKSAAALRHNFTLLLENFAQRHASLFMLEENSPAFNACD